MNETNSDTKLEPKVTFQKALEALKPDVQALVNKAITSFELNAGDRKSRKRIFGAFVAAAAEVFVNGAGGEKPISTSSLGRRSDRALNSLIPKSHALPSAADVNDDGDYTGDDEEDDTDNDE